MSEASRRQPAPSTSERPDSSSAPTGLAEGLEGPRGTAAEAEALRSLGARHVQRVAEISDAFFEARADDVSRSCWAMARRFERGGRLLVFAPPGPVESDAYHVSVEFVHPVLVGKQALPASVLAGAPAAQVETLGRPEDIAMGITSDGRDDEVIAGLRAARERGLLTLGLAGGSGGRLAEESLDHIFVIPADDPLVVQEVQETLYHVLWELVHVFFEHKGLL